MRTYAAHMDSTQTVGTHARRRLIRSVNDNPTIEDDVLRGNFALELDLTALGGTKAVTGPIEYDAVATIAEERTTHALGSGRGESLEAKIEALANAGDAKLFVERWEKAFTVSVTRSSERCDQNLVAGVDGTPTECPDSTQTWVHHKVDRVDEVQVVTFTADSALDPVGQFVLGYNAARDPYRRRAFNGGSAPACDAFLGKCAKGPNAGVQCQAPSDNLLGGDPSWMVECPNDCTSHADCATPVEGATNAVVNNPGQSAFCSAGKCIGGYMNVCVRNPGVIAKEGCCCDGSAPIVGADYECKTGAIRYDDDGTTIARELFCLGAEVLEATIDGQPWEAEPVKEICENPFDPTDCTNRPASNRTTFPPIILVVAPCVMWCVWCGVMNSLPIVARARRFHGC